VKHTLSDNMNINESLKNLTLTRLSLYVHSLLSNVNTITSTDVKVPMRILIKHCRSSCPSSSSHCSTQI
jgi:hypothetical protein